MDERPNHKRRDMFRTVCGIETFYVGGRRNVHIAKEWEYVNCKRCLKSGNHEKQKKS